MLQIVTNQRERRPHSVQTLLLQLHQRPQRIHDLRQAVEVGALLLNLHPLHLNPRRLNNFPIPHTMPHQNTHQRQSRS